MDDFLLNVSYSQVAVFNSDIEDPFNDWSDDHVAQGFAWRSQSVGFRTLIETGPALVEILMADELPSPTGIRAITVPFVCPIGSQIEVASIADRHVTEVPAGSYQLLFETGFRDEQNWCRFTFIRNGHMQPRILVCDAEITRRENLVMNAQPA